MSKLGDAKKIEEIIKEEVTDKRKAGKEGKN